ncbi:MAG: single-stranded-DNA-specific exonuclease RecJ [Lactobacillales bacterium]|jgi:single-stranded-DNA-specific exonuclease|nr:single-stranded-DNA-specific exonuclease RecJ [Lactobacillales bacterium]
MPVLGVSQSLSGFSWEFRPVEDKKVQTLVQRYNLSETIARILASREITSETAEAFLYPTLRQHLPNPFTLKDMEKAALRMAESIQNNETIGIMGDYDVDGATSTALLKMFLERLGIKTLTFIPEREDGYGPNLARMKEWHAAGCKLVATLDCGTTAFDVIDGGTKLGLDILILDHHDTEKQLPNAYAVVNPKRLDEPVDHPCRYMAAVGVVFLFTIALNTILRKQGFYKDMPEPNLIEYLDLVAFGTVCDVVKLQGVNRLFVKSGLCQMKQGKNTGFVALSELVNLSEAPSTYHLGYVFGPRINACGRVGKSDLGMKLLSCQDKIAAGALARELEELNLMRRDIESAVFQSAIEQVENRTPENPFIVVMGDNWHQGVVGIVAGRLKDKYNLPTFALSIEGDDVKGSSRSIHGVDLGALIMNALTKGILSRGGGHPMAAGFSLKKDKLNDFLAYLKETITTEKSPAKINTFTIDALIDINGANEQ